ncbi:MAG: hypothetical protein EOO45_28290 [Flavobacterium sp.]|nr:MAG: hypothetical protein EOO45_28290 [Flavobacterium sp.]
MELQSIEKLLDKYFEAETSIAEEQQLKAYFSSPGVAPHLEQYRNMFGYFAQAGTQQFDKPIPLKSKKRYVAWLSVAASVVVMFGVVTFLNNQPSEQDLGTYESPEKAFMETQKALNMLSKNVNVGVNSVEYIGEYEKSKNTIFK